MFQWLTNIFSPKKEESKAFFSLNQSRGGWLPIIRESFAGAFQQNVEIDNDAVPKYFAVFACMTLIANDIAKLRLNLTERDANGIWNKIDNPAYSPLLRKPNRIQTRIQFWEHWVLSKLLAGNVFALKGRDNRNVVTSLHVLDPNRVQILVSDEGDIFYRLNQDRISGLQEAVTVPARDIIHDRMNCLYHPLIGISPVIAAGLAAMQGLNIQTDAVHFFGNMAVPPGILTAPGEITDETANRLSEQWQQNYGGENAGKVPVLGDDLRFVPIRQMARDSQLIEQLRWTAEMVCSVFHVPPHKIGIGPTPAYNNVQAINIEYYSQALQSLIEAAELVLSDGLQMAPNLSPQFDLDDLLRMDMGTQVDVVQKAVQAGIMSPNEARKRLLSFGPVKGGATPYLQQQNWPLDVLAEREAPGTTDNERLPPPEGDPPQGGDDEDGKNGGEDGDNEDENGQTSLDPDELIRRSYAYDWPRCSSGESTAT